MTQPLDQLNQALSFLRGKKYSVTIAMATFSADDDHPVCRSLNISVDVANGFRGFADEAAAAICQLRDDGDLRLIEYTAGFKPDDHQLEYMTLEDDSVGQLLRSIPSPAQISLLGDLGKFIDHVRFYFLVLSHDNRRVVLFRRYSRNKELLRSKNLFMRLLGERYERISEPTFQFAPGFDAMLFRDHVFILNKANFHHIFRYYEQLRSIASRSLGKIRAAVPISDFDAFSASCLGHLQKLEKLKNISQKPYLKKVTIRDLKKTIREFRLKVKIVRVDGAEQLLFDPQDRWAILNLLDDAYLGSTMTGLKYEANSKRPVK